MKKKKRELEKDSVALERTWKRHGRPLVDRTGLCQDDKVFVQFCPTARMSFSTFPFFVVATFHVFPILAGMEEASQLKLVTPECTGWSSLAGSRKPESGKT